MFVASTATDRSKLRRSGMNERFRNLTPYSWTNREGHVAPPELIDLIERALAYKHGAPAGAIGSAGEHPPLSLRCIKMCVTSSVAFVAAQR